MSTVLFAFMVSLLLVHEMDAVRTKEWKMFVVLRDMPDENAYKTFAFIHIPLYFALILTIVQDGGSVGIIFLYILDCFLVGHTIIHFCFRKKVNNGFTSMFSKAIIFLSGLLAIVHFCFVIAGY